MAAWKPKEIRRWKTKQQHSSGSIHKLIRFVLFLPLFYLLLERAFLFPFEDSAISSYLDVEHVAVSTTIKKKDTKSTPVKAVRSPIFETPWRRMKSLESLTQPFRVTDASSSQCSGEKEILIAGYRHLGTTTSAEKEAKSPNSQKQKIPKLLHQQGSSRCVSSDLYDLNESWAKELDKDNGDGREWSMFFHTEDAMTRLFRAIIAVEGDEKNPKRSTLSRIGREFPQLGQILRNCVGISTFPRKLLWCFLCLYAYGGMYVDLGYSSTSPQTYDDVAKTVLRDSYNTALLWTTAKGQSGVQINPFVIAVSPGHPLMYYAVQHVLIEIVTDGFLGENFDEKFTEDKIVSDILQRALADFHEDRTVGTDQQQPDVTSLDQSTKVKTYHGSGDTRVTILGAMEVGFSDSFDLVSGKALTLESTIQKSLSKQSRLKTSTCLFKSLTEVSIVT